nr:variable surface lipoprotein [Mycoplasmopsis bovis]
MYEKIKVILLLGSVASLASIPFVAAIMWWNQRRRKEETWRMTKNQDGKINNPGENKTINRWKRKILDHRQKS